MHPLVEMFWNMADQHGQKRAFHYCRKSDHRWVDRTWLEYVYDVRKLAYFLRSKGIEKSSSLAILSENRPEWLVSDFACIVLGLVSVPLHVNASKKDQSYMIQQTEAKVLVVETLDMLKNCDCQMSSLWSVCNRKPYARRLIMKDRYHLMRYLKSLSCLSSRNRSKTTIP